MKINLNAMPAGANPSDTDYERDEEASELRRHKMFGLVGSVATLLFAATILAFAFYNRAELQFLFAKPGM